MDRIARASTGERRMVFEAAAQRMAPAVQIVHACFTQHLSDGARFFRRSRHPLRTKPDLADHKSCLAKLPVVHANTPLSDIVSFDETIIEDGRSDYHRIKTAVQFAPTAKSEPSASFAPYTALTRLRA